MSKPEENQSVESLCGSALADGDTVDPKQVGDDGMGARSVTVGRYEEIRRKAAGYARSPVHWAAHATPCVKCAMAIGNHPMHRSRPRIRSGCCSWIGRLSFTIWGSVIH